MKKHIPVYDISSISEFRSEDILIDFTFFSGVVNDSVIQIPAELQQKIISLFEDILKEGMSSQSFGTEMVRVLLLNIFILISRLNAQSHEGINSYFSKSFKKHTGISPEEFRRKTLVK